MYYNPTNPEWLTRTVLENISTASAVATWVSRVAEDHRESGSITDRSGTGTLQGWHMECHRLEHRGSHFLFLRITPPEDHYITLLRGMMANLRYRPLVLEIPDPSPTARPFVDYLLLVADVSW